MGAVNIIDRTMFYRRLVAVTVLCFIIIFALFCGFLIGRKTKHCARVESPPTSTATTNQTRSWCVAKPGTSPNMLQQNADYACNYVNCSIIEQGGVCFYVEDKLVFASVVMNLYYKSEGSNSWNCNFAGTGMITLTDPSLDRCVYA
ncbi:hypothetical protein POM88_026782 [Heracleum sosnowskyi]|uniref:X8 domain-containing protein n=1 Tax=Heracleum sosnowskyi TaxID=360622 RepID=A0AAD8I6I2_9APIA|nr:hypothetical protein POM88_026778 [Heracleum sosnowskyi]KAK1380038.1 hypothetical protein POM88_026782 [Heracleum sosnowskyi]